MIKQTSTPAHTSVRGLPLQPPIYLDGFHKQILLEGKDLVDNKFDFINIVVGHEGAGKTTFVLLSAYYQDPNITLANVVFNSAQFNEIIDEVPDGSVIIWDEADELGSHWASNIIITLKRKFKRIRKKRLSIWLVTPTVFDLNWYFIDHRTNAIWEVYTEGLTRGFWRVWTKKGKNLVIHMGKKWKFLDPKYQTKFGRFINLPKDFPISIDEYDDKKELATQEVGKESDGLNDKSTVSDTRRYMLKNFYVFCKANALKFSQQEMSEMFGFDRAILSKDFKKMGLIPLKQKLTGFNKEFYADRISEADK